MTNISDIFSDTLFEFLHGVNNHVGDDFYTSTLVNPVFNKVLCRDYLDFKKRVEKDLKDEKHK